MQRTIQNILALILITVTILAMPGPSRAAETPMLPRGGFAARPITVMIDNYRSVRSQSGFDQAALVFEALAEGGITRFMVVYNADQTLPAVIGPVRSTRRYYAEWAAGLAAIHVHAGGSPEGLAIAQTNPKIINVDGLQRGTWATFYRSRVNVIPHNLYTSGAQIVAYAATKNPQPIAERQVDGTYKSILDGGDSIGYLYRAPTGLEGRGAGQQIRYSFLSRRTNADWAYDAGQNTYVRSVKGVIARDGTSKNAITATNLIVMEATSALIAGDAKARIELGSIGTGRAKIFQEGHEYDVTWRKDDTEGRLQFFYLDGVTEVPFVMGSAWIAVVPWLENVNVR
jgi:hypothetical protein